MLQRMGSCYQGVMEYKMFRDCFSNFYSSRHFKGDIIYIFEYIYLLVQTLRGARHIKGLRISGQAMGGNVMGKWYHMYNKWRYTRQITGSINCKMIGGDQYLYSPEMLGWGFGLQITMWTYTIRRSSYSSSDGTDSLCSNEGVRGTRGRPKLCPMPLKDPHSHKLWFTFENKQWSDTSLCGNRSRYVCCQEPIHTLQRV